MVRTAPLDRAADVAAPGQTYRPDELISCLRLGISIPVSMIVVQTKML